MPTTTTAVLVAVIAAVTSVVSASLALLGVYLARRLESNAEQERIARDRKVASYQELMNQYFRLREGLRQVATSEPEPESVDGSMEDFRAIGVEWNCAVFGVWFHGSKPVAEHVRGLDESMNTLVTIAGRRRYSSPEWEAQREEASRKMDGYLDVIRVELGLPPNKIVSRYKT